MRRILEFLIAKRILILFLFFEILALTMVFRFQTYHRSAFVNNSNAVGASIHETQTHWKNYFALDDINARLAEQNRALLENKRDTLYQNFQDSGGWFNKLNLSNFEVISGEIVFNTINRPVNTFVINKGRMDGVVKGLGVSSTQGIIGKVIEVSQNYSLCLSILNIKTPVVMPKIAELTNKSGSLEWGGGNPKKVSLKGVHKFETVEKGNHIVSSAYSINFPENIPVGTITKLTKTDGSFYTIEVRLAADLSKDQYVYIFKNLKRQEIDSLLQSPNNVQ
jgi:rod shape-determining protein MreC